MIVCKFGGTSMADRRAMARCAAIIADNQEARVSVVSATAGTTEQLNTLIALAVTDKQEQVAQGLAVLRERHIAFALEVGLNDSEMTALKAILERVENRCLGVMLLAEASLAARDGILGLGEHMAAILFARALEEAGVRSRVQAAGQIMRTDTHFGAAEPQIDTIRKLCGEHLLPFLTDRHVVIAGFVGANAAGVATTLGRGGSDYSAALLAEAIDATAVHIWTDVPGIASTDPNLLPSAKTIPEINFSEAAELAVFGARVLHPATLWPAIRENIPVYVASSREPEKGGTWIRPKSQNQEPGPRAIAVRNQQTLITLTSLRMLHVSGFLASVFQILAEHRISVDMLTTSEISISLTLDQPVRFTPEIQAELARFAQIRIEENLTLVALVGNQLNSTPGLAAQIFELLAGINVRVFCGGASDHSLAFLLHAQQAHQAVTRIHRVLLEDEEVYA